MTPPELRNMIKNVYAATAAAQAAGDIPAGEGVVVARLIVQAAMQQENVQIPKT